MLMEIQGQKTVTGCKNPARKLLARNRFQDSLILIICLMRKSAKNEPVCIADEVPDIYAMLFTTQSNILALPSLWIWLWFYIYPHSLTWLLIVCVIFQLPFFTAPWRVIKKPGVISHDKMHCPAVFCIGTGIFTGTVRASAGKTDFRAFEFCSALYGFGVIPAHGMPFPAYRDAVIVDGEIAFIDRRPAAFASNPFVYLPPRNDCRSNHSPATSLFKRWLN